MSFITVVVNPDKFRRFFGSFVAINKDGTVTTGFVAKNIEIQIICFIKEFSLSCIVITDIQWFSCVCNINQILISVNIISVITGVG